MMGKEKLQLSGMSLVTIRKMMLHTLDLVDSHSDVLAPVSSCIKSANFNRSPIIVIAFDRLDFVLLLESLDFVQALGS